MKATDANAAQAARRTRTENGRPARILQLCRLPHVCRVRAQDHSPGERKIQRDKDIPCDDELTGTFNTAIKQNECDERQENADEQPMMGIQQNAPMREIAHVRPSLASHSGTVFHYSAWSRSLMSETEVMLSSCSGRYSDEVVKVQTYAAMA
jgi:hypothetical protein